jgi:hypothetical protein
MTIAGNDHLLLLSILSSPQLSKAQTVDFLDKHQPCFDEDLCDMCEELDGEEDVLRILASNPVLDASVQMRVIDEALKWQNREIGVMLDFAGNPNISNDVKEYILGEEAELHNYPGSKIIEKIAEIARDNPRISEVEIEKFLSIYSE